VYTLPYGEMFLGIIKLKKGGMEIASRWIIGKSGKLCVGWTHQFQALVE
jgi:hypothetical protein